MQGTALAPVAAPPSATGRLSVAHRHPITNLQTVRALHALCEVASVRVLESELWKLGMLEKVFGAKFEPATPECEAPDIELDIDHITPRVRIGDLERPILFPRAIPGLLRTRWPSQRSTEFLFVGLSTRTRLLTLSRWLRQNFDIRSLSLPTTGTRLGAITLRTLGAIPRTRELARRIDHRLSAGLFRGAHLGSEPAQDENMTLAEGRVLLWASNAGRQFPIKAWHDDYYAMMTSARFVLCPNGDYIWTYRFFEACLCGAIPIIEDAAECYDGFRFRTMRDRASKLGWSEEDAEWNFRKAEETLCATPEQLAHALKNAINARTGATDSPQ